MTERLSAAHLHSHALRERKIYEKDLLKYPPSRQPQQNQTENYYSQKISCFSVQLITGIHQILSLSCGEWLWGQFFPFPHNSAHEAKVSWWPTTHFTNEDTWAGEVGWVACSHIGLHPGRLKTKIPHPSQDSLTFCNTVSPLFHRLESRLPGEISITSDMQITAPLWHKVRRN